MMMVCVLSILCFQEIRDKYPPWLESTSMPAEEAKRYHDQVRDRAILKTE